MHVAGVERISRLNISHVNNTPFWRLLPHTIPFDRTILPSEGLLCRSDGAVRFKHCHWTPHFLPGHNRQLDWPVSDTVIRQDVTDQRVMITNDVSQKPRLHL